MARLSIQLLEKKCSAPGGSFRFSLRGVSMDTEEGGLLTLAGPAGSGKSALLRIVAGLEMPSAGEIRMGERLLNPLGPKERRVAMVFSEPSLHPRWSVFENMAFGLGARGVARGDISGRIRGAAEMLGLEKCLDVSASAVSPAQQVLVALGRAAVRGADCVLLDNPLASLDRQSRRELRGSLRTLHTSLGTPMIFATDCPEEAMDVGGQLVVMSDGKVAQSGSPDQVYARPAGVAVAGFLGAPPMNLVRGSLRRVKKVLMFEERDGGAVRIPVEGHPEIERFEDGEIVLGLRAEDCSLVPDGTPRGNGVFPAVVESVEPSGCGAVLRLQTGSNGLLARVPEMPVEDDTGRRVLVRCELARVHFFDAATGRRIDED